MEEDEYKATYNALTEARCVFEKALTNNQCKCRYSKHFCLADREGYACESKELAGSCQSLLDRLRESSRFFLKIHSVGSQLPHNADIRIQVGGLRGLRALLSGENNDEPVADIRALLDQAEAEYQTLERLPYSEVVQTIASYQGRTRSKRGHKKD